jgi:hypothetical protein
MTTIKVRKLSDVVKDSKMAYEKGKSDERERILEIINFKEILKQFKRELVFSDKQEKELEGELFDIDEVRKMFDILKSLVEEKKE